MTTSVLIADRGVGFDLAHHPQAGAPVWLAAARGGQLRTVGVGFTIWIQVRGIGRLNAREGVFTLAPGEWLALDRSGDGGFVRSLEGQPNTTLHVGRHGLAIGLSFAADAFPGRRRGDLLPGRGRVSRRDLRIALRLWRNGVATARAAVASGASGASTMHAVQAMVAHIGGFQRELDVGISRCPGRSIWRKRQVFGRLQRARLYLEGHRDRVVRLTELAELTSFSSWYLSKTFHVIYQESPQAASVRLRLERACELLAATAGLSGGRTDVRNDIRSDNRRDGLNGDCGDEIDQGTLPVPHAFAAHDTNARSERSWAQPSSTPQSSTSFSSLGLPPLGPASTGGLTSSSLASISEIGAACGFENSCSFARAFRARFGMTASDYRERLRRQASAGHADALHHRRADQKAG